LGILRFFKLLFYSPFGALPRHSSLVNILPGMRYSGKTGTGLFCKEQPRQHYTILAHSVTSRPGTAQTSW